MGNKPRVALTAEDKRKLFPVSKPHADGTEHNTKAERKRETVLHLAELQSWICFWCGR